MDTLLCSQTYLTFISSLDREGVRNQDQDLHQDHRIRGYGLQGDRAQEARQVLNKGRHMKLDLIRIISSKKPECIMQDADR